ncbi:hypothetical protein ACFOWE_08380 [Planomonospora corallina]|uniref:Uncharacterized protein n=1 Tax=Planomonospora corallina TaxID=1806052 RepID=A0ABV8I2E4_9ACTN
MGELESWRDGVLAVRKRDGSLVEIAEETLVAARIVTGGPRTRTGGLPG